MYPNGVLPVDHDELCVCREVPEVVVEKGERGAEVEHLTLSKKRGKFFTLYRHCGLNNKLIRTSKW